MWVSPFRYLRLIGYLLLPEAFRSLSRLSSALSAKASTLRSFLLGHSDLIALTSDGWCCLVCFYFFAVFLQRLVSSLSYVLRILDVSYMQFSRYDYGSKTFVFLPSGDKEIRTLDPLLARQVLSQLSYIPIFTFSSGYYPVGLSGLEPPTSRLSGVRSNQLSYKPSFVIRQPPAFPCRLQHSIIGRLSLNHRVRDGNGCLP